MYSPSLVRLCRSVALFVLLGSTARADEPPPRIANRPVVPGVLLLKMQERREEPTGSGQLKASERIAEWKVAETAIIICDMWDDHHCKMAAHRSGLRRPRRAGDVQFW